MKKFKKLLSFALTLIIAFSVLSVCALPTSAAVVTGTTPQTAIPLIDKTWNTLYWTHDNYNAKYYNKIVLPSRGYIDFAIEKPIDSDGDVSTVALKLYNTDSVVIWNGNKSSGKEIFNDYYSYKIGLDAGTYYMEIDPSIYVSSSSAPIKTEYRYVFTKSSAWEMEENNDYSTANEIALEKTYSAVLTQGTSSYDYFKVNLTKGKKYTITFGNYDDGVTYNFYDPDQSSKSFTEYDYDWYYGQKKVSDGKLTWTFTAEASGYHYIRIYDYPDQDITYTVKAATYKTPTSELSFKLSTTSYTYNGSVRTPGVTVKDASGKTLKKNTDYTVTYPSGRKAVGTYKVTVKMKGDYTGTKTLTFKINPLVNITKGSVKLSTTSYTYNGKVKTPGVTLKDSSGKTLKKNTDYTVTYSSGRKNVGTYKVIIKGKGKYTGTKTLTFTIKPTTKSSITTAAGATVKIGAKSNKKITYTTSNSKVAKVNSKGTITAVKAGTATITVKSGTISQKIKVKVTKPSVKISASKKTMYIGTSLQLKATTNPSGAKVTWSVNNKKLAKISSSGKLTALKKGTVTVTAKFKYKGKTYSSTYKVKISVEYPDVSVFISSDFEYDNLYAFTLTNDSNSTVKILNKGYAYCSGDSGDIKSLYTVINGVGGNYKSIKVSKGSTVTAVATLDEYVQFYTIYPTSLYLYIEYRGETFKLSCSTDRYGIDKCHTITWLYD